MPYYKRIIFVAAIVFAFGGCNIINPAEPVPAYIHIDSIFLKTDASTQGSNSNKIKDAWVYIDENPVGVYELPTNFPVLLSGNHHISISAGVLENGINATHILYPFYTAYTKDITLESGKTIYIPSQTVSYYASAQFPFNPEEDFETATTFVPGATSDTTMIITHDAQNVFEGTGSGEIYLADGKSLFEVDSKTFTVPQTGEPVYLEMNYKTTLSFNVGLIAVDASGEKNSTIIIALNPTSNWNKIYIDLASTITQTPGAVKFAIFFSALRTDTSGNEQIFFDNIKVVHL
jgi:hypothetical protein